MAELVSQQDFPLMIEFSHFALQECDEECVPEPYPDGREPVEGAFLTERVGRIDVESAGHTHTTVLECEVWDGRPPVDERVVWEEQGEADIVSQSGRLAVWTVGGACAEDIHLVREDTKWRVRICCAGREEARRQAEQGVPCDVERYLLQFWPAEG
ncbi:hypothetical protein [Streptomyces sp. YGL11-2]|uniref:hypothetical protein n=1 Tax=Streptomyces sp. YGL11-2 TaxID=3414028 RepID=UPI003CED7819